MLVYLIKKIRRILGWKQNVYPACPFIWFLCQIDSEIIMSQQKPEQTLNVRSGLLFVILLFAYIHIYIYFILFISDLDQHFTI